MVAKAEVANYLMDKIERLEAFEEKVGIRYDNISIIVDYSDFDENPWNIEVLGELKEHENGNLANSKNRNIENVVILYNAENRIIESRTSSFAVRDYLGFTTFKVYISDLKSVKDIKKIRIYPKWV